jgi:hypothetical protein
LIGFLDHKKGKNDPPVFNQALLKGAPRGGPRGPPGGPGPPPGPPRDPPRAWFFGVFGLYRVLATGRPRGPPRGGPPGPAPGPRPPIGGAPPRGDEGTVFLSLNKHNEKPHEERHGAIDRKRGVKTPTKA